jgi:hypothetical protein
MIATELQHAIMAERKRYSQLSLRKSPWTGMKKTRVLSEDSFMMYQVRSSRTSRTDRSPATKLKFCCLSIRQEQPPIAILNKRKKSQDVMFLLVGAMVGQSSQ